MELLTALQAELRPFERQYRHSIALALTGLLIVGAIAAGSACLGYNAWIGGSRGVGLLAFWIALWIGLFAALLWKIFRQRLQSSNWLVRVYPDGLSIKFRSYLNDHFDPADPAVVHISYSEIEFVRDRRIRQEVPAESPGSIETRYQRFAEFRLRDDETLAEIARLAAIERSRPAPRVGRWIRSRTKFGDHPVQVADGFLRIAWRVRPRLSEFLADVASRIEVREQTRSLEDFTELRPVSRAAQEDALLKLISAGDRMGAIRIIRQLYGYDLTEAVGFLDELSKSGRSSGADRGQYLN